MMTQSQLALTYMWQSTQYSGQSKRLNCVIVIDCIALWVGVLCVETCLFIFFSKIIGCVAPGWDGVRNVWVDAVCWKAGRGLSPYLGNSQSPFALRSTQYTCLGDLPSSLALHNAYFVQLYSFTTTFTIIYDMKRDGRMVPYKADV